MTIEELDQMFLECKTLQKKREEAKSEEERDSLTKEILRLRRILRFTEHPIEGGTDEY